MEDKRLTWKDCVNQAVCAACGVETTLPFRPRGDRPAYCRTCFSAQVPVGV